MAIFVESPGVFRKTVNIDLASVSAGATSRQDFTVKGLQPGMILKIAPATAALTTGLEILGAYCFAADTLTVAVFNSTASPINEAAADFNLISL